MCNEKYKFLHGIVLCISSNSNSSSSRGNSSNSSSSSEIKVKVFCNEAASHLYVPSSSGPLQEDQRGKGEREKRTK